MKLRTVLMFLIFMNFNIAYAGAIVEAIRPQATSDIDFGRNIKVVKSNNTLNFETTEKDYKVKKENNITEISYSNEEIDGQSAENFYSEVKGTNQAIGRVSTYIYDRKSKPQRGSLYGHVWQLEDGKLTSYSRCQKVDYSQFLNFTRASTDEFCFTVTPENCGKLLNMYSGLEKELKSDVEACAKTSEKVEGIIAIVEPDKVHLKNIKFMSELSMKNKTHPGLKPGKTTSETLLNELKTIDIAVDSCNKYVELWKNQGQLGTDVRPIIKAKSNQ